MSNSNKNVDIADVINAINNTMEQHDSYTASHQKRVAELAAAIAKKLKLSDEEIKEIYLGSLIHDIGKTSLSASLLNKPGSLSKKEYEEIKKHTYSGERIIRELNLPEPIVKIILEHHEHIDGTGYPKKLKDLKISLPARIVTVADVVEAIAHDRPYRQALGIDTALAHIKEYRGTSYDAEVVDVCVKLFEEKEFKFD